MIQWNKHKLPNRSQRMKPGEGHLQRERDVYEGLNNKQAQRLRLYRIDIERTVLFRRHTSVERISVVDLQTVAYEVRQGQEKKCKGKGKGDVDCEQVG
jgi:hypothetical protein